jgi:hypothetical protein
MIARPDPGFLIDNIRLAGQTANLVLCLDARDKASYPGSGNKWLDLSGNGYDFFKGTDGTTAAPTFNGTAGNMDCYWSFNGSQYFTYDSANEAWMDAMHKNNALFSWVLLMRHGTGEQAHFGTNGTSTTGGTGFNLTNGATEVLACRARNAGAAALATETVSSMVESANNFLAVSINEAAGGGGGVLRTNNNLAIFDATYSSPAAGAASETLQIGALGGGVLPYTSASRLIACAAWSGRALTSAEVLTLRQLCRNGLGI